MTEKENNIISKWDFLMQDLPQSKIKRRKFARIYEKIVRYNRKEDLSMLLSIAYRTFKKVDDIQLSNSRKQLQEMAEFLVDDFYINGTILSGHFTMFCESVARKIAEQLSNSKIGNLEIRTDNNIKKIYLAF